MTGWGSSTRRLLWCLTPFLCAATFRSAHFEVTASDVKAAEEIARMADKLRLQFAQEWLGKPLPNWPQRCHIDVRFTLDEAGGYTSFRFAESGGVIEQTISLEGRRARVFGGALPHEITHTVLAGHFAKPLPRWADEGAATLAEDDRKRSLHDMTAQWLVRNGRAYSFDTLFETDRYPKELHDFYAQSYSVTRFLVEREGKAQFLKFLSEAAGRSWALAAEHAYKVPNLIELENQWKDWVRARQPGAADRATSSGAR